MNQIVKWIGIVVGLLLTILLVVFLINGANWGRNTSNSTMSDTQNTINTAYNTKLTQYDGRTVTGTEVLSAVDTFQGQDYAIVIAPKSLQKASASLTCCCAYLDPYNPTYAGAWKVDSSESNVPGQALWGDTTGDSPSILKDNTKNTYVNPNGKFKGKMIMDDNDTIIGVYFYQV